MEPLLRSRRKAHLGLVLLGVLVVLTGCFGGSLLSPKPTPSPTPVAMHGQIFGPQGVQTANGAASDAAATLAKASNSPVSRLFGARVEAAAGTGTPLAGESGVANVAVLVYVLADYLNNPGVAPVAQTTTDANGKYTVSDIPVGKDLLIVTGATPRLSAIVLNADKDTSGDVNSVTSLATEAWVERLRGDASMTIDAGSLQDTLNAAESALLALDAAELLAALTALVPAQLGDGWPTDLAPQWRSIANDIDAGPTREWSSNGFEPVGTRNEPFIGTFDGRGHVIDGLYIRRGSGDLGLFGAAGETAVISDVGIINAEVGGRASTMGILLGYGSGTKVVNAYSSGQVTARSGVAGGLVGQMGDGGLIEDAYSSADVVAIESGGSIGGLVALLTNGSTISNSYSTGSVDGNGGVGGLGGSFNGGSIIASYSEGDVFGADYHEVVWSAI